MSPHTNHSVSNCKIKNICMNLMGHIITLFLVSLQCYIYSTVDQETKTCKYLLPIINGVKCECLWRFSRCTFRILHFYCASLTVHLNNPTQKINSLRIHDINLFHLDIYKITQYHESSNIPVICSILIMHHILQVLCKWLYSMHAKSHHFM